MLNLHGEIQLKFDVKIEMKFDWHVEIKMKFDQHGEITEDFKFDIDLKFFSEIEII